MGITEQLIGEWRPKQAESHNDRLGFPPLLQRSHCQTPGIWCFELLFNANLCPVFLDPGVQILSYPLSTEWTLLPHWGSLYLPSHWLQIRSQRQYTDAPSTTVRSPATHSKGECGNSAVNVLFHWCFLFETKIKKAEMFYSHRPKTVWFKERLKHDKGIEKVSPLP